MTLHTARRGARGPATRTRSRPPGKVALLLGQANLRRAAHRAERIGVPQLGWARAAHATSRPVAWLRFVPGRRAPRPRGPEIWPAARGVSRRKELRRPRQVRPPSEHDARSSRPRKCEVAAAAGRRPVALRCAPFPCCVLSETTEIKSGEIWDSPSQMPDQPHHFATSGILLPLWLVVLFLLDLVVLGFQSCHQNTWD